jgi:hypothetical protein
MRDYASFAATSCRQMNLNNHSKIGLTIVLDIFLYYSIRRYQIIIVISSIVLCHRLSVLCLLLPYSTIMAAVYQQF